MIPALVITLAFLAACNDDSDTNAGATNTPPVISASFHNADTEPKSWVDTRGYNASVTLAASDPEDFGSFSRFSFFFLELVPDVHVKYVDEPIACGSGEPVAVAGEAFLEVSFTPARAHDDEGAPTHLPSPDDPDSMPSVLEVVETCDFEGQLTFVFGVVEPDLAFRLNVLTQIGNRETVAIDIGNP